MNDLVSVFEKKQIEKLTSKKRIPAFRAGDTIKVTLKIVEGERSRLQAFEGMCIARKNNSVNSKFTVRKISHGEGVERVFPLFSPNIDKIEIIRKGNVKRAKLYYLRKRTGKSARIADRDRGEEADQYALIENNESEDLENKNIDKVEKNTDDKKTKQEAVNNEEDTSKSVSEKKITEEPVVEENKSVKEKSESTASEADKTKDESKK